MTWRASWHVETEVHIVCKDQAINETWWQARQRDMVAGKHSSKAAPSAGFTWSEQAL